MTEADETRIEEAYWNFDARRKGYAEWKGASQTERDAFKWELRRILGAKQAIIDRLMLEHCPGEMTGEQVEVWAGHQKAVIDPWPWPKSEALSSALQKAKDDMQPIKDAIELKEYFNRPSDAFRYCNMEVNRKLAKALKKED